MCSNCAGGWDGEPDSEPYKVGGDSSRLCSECGHKVSLHEKEYGCDYEADRPDADIGQVAWRCGCRAVIRG